jgi:ATP-binding cassette subfamily B protein
MTYTQPAIKDFLKDTVPFNQLPQSELDALSEQIRLLRYRVGQPIVRQETLPYQLAIVLEGKVRLLGYEPSTQNPFSLQMLQSGDMLGWAGLLRGVACETAIASEETICLTLAAQNFLDLIQKYPEFARRLENQVSIAEISSLLGNLMHQQAKQSLDLRQTCLEAFPLSEVIYSSGATPNLRADYTWFLSAGITADGTPVGSSLTVEEAKNLRGQGSDRLRLVGVPTNLLSPAEEEEEADTVLTPTVIRSVQNGTGNDTLEITYAPEVPPEPDLAVYREERGRQHYPFEAGKNPLGSGIACFQMLTQYFGMRSRRDVVRRVLADQMARTGSLNLNLCGAVSELLGLKAQLVKVPVSAMARLQTPALILWEDSVAVLYETSQRQMVVAVPSQGIRRLSLNEFHSYWGDAGEVLLLEKTKATPQEKFGLSWFWPSVKKFRGVLTEVFIASFFVQLFGLANPLMIQVIIDKVIVQNSVDTLHVLGVFLVVIAVAEALLTYLRTYLFVDTTNRIDMALGSEIIDHLLRLPLRYFDKRPVGELSSRVNELERIRQFLTGTALTVVLDAVFSVLYIVVMVLYSWKLTAASLATIPLFVGLTAVVSPIIRDQLRTKAERNAQTQSHLVEVVSGIQTVKAQNIELKSRWRWQERYAQYVSAGFKNVQTSTAASSASNFLNKISALVVLWFGAALVLSGDLTLGQLIAFRIISGYVTGPMLRLAQVWQNFQETALSLERLSDIIDTPQEESEADRDNIPMPLIKGHVKYENVSFRFVNNGPPVLTNVSLEFQPGTFVGIVGQSGSGKSTLMKLLPRLYDAQSGRIFIDQYDTMKVELYSLRRQVGIVPQDSLLFDGTVQENIGLTNPSATPEEIIEAAQTAAAHEFIMALPAGYNTPVGEKGAALSGGQRQRVAIARTILQNPQLLILDEATSALDYETERQVSMNLQERYRDRTVFFITHRLSTIRGADVIVVMDQGSVVEIGTHKELMEQRGRYFCLYQQQDANL